MKSATLVSANYLERVADPASRFHSDYLAYKKQQVSRAQLAARLTHMAMIGDSLSRDVYVSSALSTFWRARRRHGNNWFLNTDLSHVSINSVFERLETLTPLVATEYSGLGALVDDWHERQNFFRRILRTRNFSGQVSQVLSRERFADLILIWIGHNNIDWAWRCPPEELKRPEERLQRLSHRFRCDYERQLQRLIARARMEHHRVAMVVYGLVDFESFFKAREVAEALREKDPKLYPYLGMDLKYLISMRPAYRGHLIRLVRMVNAELDTMVKQLSRELEHVSNVQVRYCDVLAKADLSRVEVIHPVDGWHPSVEGHKVFAEAAFGELAPSLEFLGINRATVAA
jgi:lysophospholipase L1-like esterase